MKKVLIISPNFPPVNSADMHRVRHIVNFLTEFGWYAEVVTVTPAMVESYSTDDLLLKSLPNNLKVHFVQAWDVKWTRKFGLGSLSMRSFLYYRRKVNSILTENVFDLVFFSTTAFHVMALGPYWKRKFDIPFVIDIQDPWRSDFYLDKPTHERPPKFWISYNLDKYLEKITIPRADGIISVSETYLEIFKKRYGKISSNNKVIPFAGFEKDFEIIGDLALPSQVQFSTEEINIVYVGRGGYDMHMAVEIYFSSLNLLKERNPDIFSRVKTFFLGTSYAPKGKGKATLAMVGINMENGHKVLEISDRFEYFSTLKILQSADILFIPGSVDVGYTASKVFPYILAKRPLIACVSESSSVVDILKACTNAEICTFKHDTKDTDFVVNALYRSLVTTIGNIGNIIDYDAKEFERYSARFMTKDVVSLFDYCLTKA